MISFNNNCSPDKSAIMKKDIKDALNSVCLGQNKIALMH